MFELCLSANLRLVKLYYTNVLNIKEHELFVLEYFVRIYMFTLTN